MEERFSCEIETDICTEKQLKALRKRVSSLEELTINFKKRITIELVDTISGRFEKLEGAIDELNSKIEYLRTECVNIKSQIVDIENKVQDEVKQIARMKEEERDMDAALKKLAGQEKLKVDRRPLDQLRK